MRRSMGPLFALLLTASALAGCIGDGGEGLEPTAGPTPDLSHLEAPGASATEDLPDGARAFAFEGSTTTGGLNPLVGDVPPTPFLAEPFEVDASVGHLALVLDYDGAMGELNNLNAFLVDPEGRVQCGAATTGTPKRCTTPVVAASGVESWTVEVRTAFAAALPGTAFEATVTLHPVGDLPLGDPLAGVDTTITFRAEDTGAPGAEPTIGLLSDGTIFVQEDLATMRSTDDGRTWEDVAPLTTSQETFDPMLRVDPWTDTVYIDQLYIACSILAWSSDAGASWTTNPAACGAPGNDHQKLAVGPNPVGLPFNTVYYAYASFFDGGMWVSRSIDGGATFTTHRVVGPESGWQPKNTGPIEADRDGGVFVPYYLCDGGMAVGVSHDFGVSWEMVRVVEDPDITCDGTHRTDSDAGLAIDAEGTLYLAYRNDTATQYAVSTDRGLTWGAPVQVSPPTLLSHVHVDAVAGDAGRLAITYRATPDSDLGPNADGWAAWHQYVSFVEDAAGPEPTVRTAIVNDPEDPVQRGPICTLGAACAGGSRNLLDFIDVQLGPDGRVYVAYADGCPGECPMPADSRERLGMVGVQDEGPRLFANGAPWA